MQRNSLPSKTAAFVLAMIDAVAAHGRGAPVTSVRLLPSSAPQVSGDAYQQGRSLLALGDVTGALGAFRRALTDNPKSVEALNGIAVCYDRFGRYDVSRSYYEAALAIAPDAAMVLNNYGYSLYLQGDVHAAIPVLQKAAAGNDDEISAASQRTLTLIASALQASPEATVQVADAATPSAHIEQTSSGEQRLVLGGKAPSATLVADLGDAAALVAVPKAWTDADQTALKADAQRADRAAAKADVVISKAVAARDAGDALAAVANRTALHAVLDASAAENTAGLMMTGAVGPTGSAQLFAGRPMLPAQVRAAIVLARPGISRLGKPQLRAGASLLPELAYTKFNPSSFARPPRIAIDSVVDGAANWLVSERSIAAENAPRMVTARRRGGASRATHFDSDDKTLNLFAARMRGADVAPEAQLVTPAVAIARLEALIARVRAA